MGCDKRYGLRDVWVAPEAFQFSPAVFADTNYLQHCIGSNFPAVYRENLENQEATGNRGQSLAFDGAQNEIAWDVTVMVPASSVMGTPGSLPESLQALFWAAGFGSQLGPSSWTPGATGILMGMTAKSACGRTIQLAGLDRDKRQLELLTGAVVSQVAFSFSRTDMCTIQFSGVAGMKFEALAPILGTGDLSSTTLTATTTTTFGVNLLNSPNHLTGIDLTLPGASGELDIIHGNNQITLDNDLSASTITGDTQSYWSIPKPSTTYAVMSPADWSVSGFDSVQTASATVETGQGYGELTTQFGWPSELLSAQVKVSGSITAYIVDSNLTAIHNYETGAEFKINFDGGVDGTAPAGAYLDFKTVKLTEVPAYDLSSVDTPASGDFSFQAGESGTFSSNDFLDTISLLAN